MNATNQFILKRIYTWVWSGFYPPHEVDEMIDDILEPEADEPMLRGAVANEFEKKRLAESTWPQVTDCDRLDRAFDELDAFGMVALQNAGFTSSDAMFEVESVYDDDRTGYCFYHEQELERTIDGGGLSLSFGCLDDDSRTAEVGQLLRETLEKHGFKVKWDGCSETKVHVAPFEWKRRG